MQINTNPNFNYATKRNNAPAFTAVSLYGGSEAVLKKVLKHNEWKEVSELFENQKENHLVQLIFWGKGEGSNKLTARLVQEQSEFVAKTKDYSQGFFQGTLKFIKKMCERADAMKDEVAKTMDVNTDKILNRYKD